MDPAVVNLASIQAYFGGRCSTFERSKARAAMSGRGTALALASIVMAACSSSGGSYQVVRVIDGAAGPWSAVPISCRRRARHRSFCGFN
jgi:hypothetical protein